MRFLLPNRAFSLVVIVGAVMACSPSSPQDEVESQADAGGGTGGLPTVAGGSAGSSQQGGSEGEEAGGGGAKQTGGVGGQMSPDSMGGNGYGQGGMGAKVGAGGSGNSGSAGAPQCPQTTLPGKISGVEPEAHSYHPPMMDGNGNLYRVTESEQSDGNQFRMMKSADGGATWKEMDQGNRPMPVDIEGAYQVQTDKAIYLSVSVGKRIHWSQFNTSDHSAMPDKWVADERVDDNLSSSGVKQFSSLARASDGQFIIAYSDKLSGSNQQIAYRWRVGNNTYGPKVSVEGAAGSWTGPRVVMGRNDVAHLIYKDHKAHKLYWRKIPKGEAPSEPVRIDNGGTSRDAVPHVHPLVFEQDGKEVVVVAFAGADGTLKATTIVDGQVGSEETLSAGKVLQNPEVVLNEGAVASLALHGTSIYAAWTDAGSGDVKYRARSKGQGWGQEKVFWNSGSATALYLYCSVVTSGNCPRLACSFDVGPHADDKGNIHFTEAVLNVP